MDLAALVIAGVSILIAGASWRAAKRSASAAEASAQEAAALSQIEKARHLNENTPTFDLRGNCDAHGLVTFTLTITGPEATYTAEVEVIEGSYVQYLRTEEDGTTSTPRIGLGDLRQGVPVSFYGHQELESEKHQRFTLHLTDGTEYWPVYAECQIQWPPMVSSVH